MNLKLADNTSREDPRLAELLERLMQQRRQGQAPDFAAIARQYPDLADELADLWSIAQLADGLAQPKPERSTASYLSATPPPPAELLPSLPRTFADFEILGELGRGGMGIVYKARQLSLNRTVALKVMLRGDFATDAERARFRAEAEAAAQLKHPNIVQIYEVGEWHDENSNSPPLPYFSMSLIEGEPLSRRIAEGPLPPREAARIVALVARAIQHAHDQGVVHRDLKPSNILLETVHGESQGRPLLGSAVDARAGCVPYVADFGLAKFFDPDATDRQYRTQTGAILGTPAYMAPEQAAGTRGLPGPAADVYSLGAILYECLTGRPPFQAATPVDTILLVLEQDPVPPRLLNPKVDRELETICLRCLQKPADLRYPSAAALASDLEAFLAGEQLSMQPSGLGYLFSRLLRETHHAPVLENWGLLWMWHSLMIWLLCLLTQAMHWANITSHWAYLTLWTGGLATWGMVFWQLRRRGGPVLFVERQIAHAWAAGTSASIALFLIEVVQGLEPLSLAPVLAIISGMIFLFKAGTLSGVFYLATLANFVTAIIMARYPQFSHVLFGTVSAACFFFPGLMYYRRRKR
jgi:serine/threonine protein kinase